MLKKITPCILYMKKLIFQILGEVTWCILWFRLGKENNILYPSFLLSHCWKNKFF